MTKTWSLEEATAIFNLPIIELLYKAQTIHMEHFAPGEVQVASLLSIKTGGCPENCAYCSQSAHHKKTDTTKVPLSSKDEVLAAAAAAKASGATRFCLGAAWRHPRDVDLEIVCDMITGIRDMGMETCVTLGMLKEHQAIRLKSAGLDYYNHNIDTSDDYYPQIITTHTFADRLATIANLRKANIKVCCGVILGMGETNADRIKALTILANFDPPPESVPINKLIKVPGTPLHDRLTPQDEINNIDFIRAIALARILMPKTWVRLSAGRAQMSEEMQAMCFMGGANSIFYGNVLLTKGNQLTSEDDLMFEDLGLTKVPPPQELRLETKNILKDNICLQVRQHAHDVNRSQTNHK